jgi:hypothetical protein
MRPWSSLCSWGFLLCPTSASNLAVRVCAYAAVRVCARIHDGAHAMAHWAQAGRVTYSISIPLMLYGSVEGVDG